MRKTFNPEKLKSLLKRAGTVVLCVVVAIFVLLLISSRFESGESDYSFVRLVDSSTNDSVSQAMKNTTLDTTLFMSSCGVRAERDPLSITVEHGKVVIVQIYCDRCGLDTSFEITENTSQMIHCNCQERNLKSTYIIVTFE